MASTDHPKLTIGDPDPGTIERVQSQRIKREYYIPPELLSHVLSLLPASSVLRFRSVCNLWSSITHDPYFINTHLQRAPKSILIFILDNGKNHSIKLIDSKGAPKPFLTQRILKGLSYASLKSCCNGLFCIESSGGVELFNPTTQESLTAPTATKVKPGFYTNFKLGFHPATKEYKIIHFFAKINDLNDEMMECEVYTVGTTSWRKICDVDYYPVPWERGVTVKGSIYLRVHNISERVYSELSDFVSFDLKDERFTPFQLPSFDLIYGVNMYYIDKLVELQGNVCVSVSPHTCSESCDRALDIWMLNDDHVANCCWSRRYSIRTPWSEQMPNPLLIEKEQILIHVTCRARARDFSLTKSGYYEASCRTMLRYHCFNGGRSEVCWKDNHRIKPFVHVESLVPLRNQGVQ